MRTVAGLSLLLLIGVLLGASMLVYSAYVLLAVFWVSHKLSQRWTLALAATRTMSADEVVVGEDVAIQIRLDNRDRWPIAWVLVEDVLPQAALHAPPAALRVEGNHLRMCSLPAGGSRIVHYKLHTLRRGYFQIGPVIAETGDLLGLHRRFRKVTDAAYLLVLPKLIPLSGYDVASRRPVGEVKVSYRLQEDPTMISGIRRYEQGDPLRSIHWRATARTGQLQCKQYQPTSVAGAARWWSICTRAVESRSSRAGPHRPGWPLRRHRSATHCCLLQQQSGLISNGRDAVDRLADTEDARRQKVKEYASLQDAKRAVAMKSASDRLRPVVLPTGRGPRTTFEIHRAASHGLKNRWHPPRTTADRNAEPNAAGRHGAGDSAGSRRVGRVGGSGMLRRQGYSVAAVVNNYDNEAFTTAVGRLLAQRITVYHLLDEESIHHICKDMVLKY